MKLIHGLALAAFALASCKSAEVAELNPEEVLKLDPWRSTLQATVIKNETVPVTLRFPNMEGSLSFKPAKAKVSANIETLETGDKARDENITKVFFEAAKNALFKKAEFQLTHLEGDPTSLAEGEALYMKAKGQLYLHGVNLELNGRLNVKRLPAGAFAAEFKDSWTINIKEVNMLEALANLNAICPQPHRVGHNVKLSGELVYVKP